MSYMKGFYKRFIISVLFVCNSFSINAQQMSPGIKSFVQNDPASAIPLLEKELQSEPSSLDVYNYLGLAYSQTGNYSKAAEVFEKGISVPGTNKKVLYYNLANACYKLEDYQKAVDSYSMSIVADSSFAEPYLNRANAYLKMNDIDKCISDYVRYLELKPDDPQEPKIRRLLVLLNEEKEIRLAEQKRKEEEALRLKQEEERLAQAKAEQERLAEQKRLEEEARRKKLLEDVANSLKQSSDTTNITAGAEEVLNYYDESEID